jgi:hypothetical protein
VLTFPEAEPPAGSRGRWRRSLILFAFVFCAAAPGAATCQVLLNEVMADPARDWNGDGGYQFRDDEWVEIVNAGSGPVDLAGYFVGDESGAFVYGFTGELSPGEVRVVFGSDSVIWEQANGESSTGLRLGNDGDTVTLWQVADGDTIPADAYLYNTHEAEDDRSSGRAPDGGPTWEIFDGLNPYSGEGPPAGNGGDPSPGARNDGTGGTAVAVATWGRVKALFAS